MLLAFIIALSINLMRGLKFECGCFTFGEANGNSDVCFVADQRPMLFSGGTAGSFLPEPPQRMSFADRFVFKKPLARLIVETASCANVFNFLLDRVMLFYLPPNINSSMSSWTTMSTTDS